MLFHLGTILSITTGILLAEEGDYPVDGVYRILNFMTNDNLQTIQLPRAGKECRPYLLEQLPFLREITTLQLSAELEIQRSHSGVDVKALLQPYVEKYGEMHEVRSIHAEDHERIDPVEELARLRPDLAEEGNLHLVLLPDEDTPSDIGEINWK